MFQDFRPAASFLTTLLGLTLAGTSPKAQKPELGQVLTEDRLIDKDYRFELLRPDRSWRILGQKEIRQLVPDAIAGLTLIRGKGHGMIMRVKVHPLYGASLEHSVNMVVSGFGSKDVEILSRKPGKLRGRDCVELVVRRQMDGMTQRYKVWILTRDGYVFLLLVQGSERWMADGKTFAKIPSAIRFLDGEIHPRIGSSRIADTHGIGWRIRDNVYASAASGLRVRPATGWRLIVGQEALWHCPGEDIGILLPGQDLLVSVRSEALPSGAEPAWLESASSLPSQDLPLPAGERILRLRCLGGARTFHVIDHHKPRPYRSYETVWVHGGRGWSVYIRQEGLDPPDVRKKIESVLDGISQLNKAEIEELGHDLHGLRDLENSVGPEESLRGGTYREFQHGLIWKKPKMGFWTASCGTKVQDLQPGCRLSALELTSGVAFLLCVEPGEDKDLGTLHATRVGYTSKLLVDVKTGETRTWELQGHAARTTILDGTLENQAYRYRVTSILIGKNHVSLITSALRGNHMNAEKVVIAVERSLATDGAFQATQRTKDGYIDLRSGFGIRALPKEARIKDITPTEIRSAASWALIDSGKVQLEIRALTGGMTNETLVGYLIGNARDSTFFEAISGTPESQSAITFLGLPAIRLRWKNWHGESEVIVVRRDSTSYTFTGRAKAKGWEKLLSKIYWID